VQTKLFTAQHNDPAFRSLFRSFFRSFLRPSLRTEVKPTLIGKRTNQTITIRIRIHCFASIYPFEQQHRYRQLVDPALELGNEDEFDVCQDDKEHDALPTWSSTVIEPSAITPAGRSSIVLERPRVLGLDKPRLHPAGR
jgi:hypothetical protein